MGFSGHSTSRLVQYPWLQSPDRSSPQAQNLRGGLPTALENSCCNQFHSKVGSRCEPQIWMCHSNFYQALGDSCWIPSSICHGDVEFLFTARLSFPHANFSRAGNLTTPEDTCHVKKFNLSSFLFALQLPPNDRLHNSDLLLLLTCNQRSKLTGRRNLGRKICCYLQFQTIHQPTQKHHNKRALQDLNRKSEPFTVCQSSSR